MTWLPKLSPKEQAEKMDALNAYLDTHKAAAAARGEGMFRGIPDSWYEAARWRCVSGHVLGFVFESWDRGGDVCPSCGLSSRLTFPEDVTTPA